MHFLQRKMNCKRKNKNYLSKMHKILTENLYDINKMHIAPHSFIDIICVREYYHLRHHISDAGNVIYLTNTNIITLLSRRV